MVNFLQQMLGGGQQRQEYEDFVNRYDQGPPWAGISDQEAVSRYEQVATQLPPDAYQQSAEAAFSRMSPQERAQLMQMMRQRAQQQGMDFPDLNQDGIDDRVQQDPRYMAQVTTRMREQEPGGLGALLGGGGGMGSMMSNPLAKAAMAGVAAMAVKQFMGRR